jgi:hypothetical protein
LSALPSIKSIIARNQESATTPPTSRGLHRIGGGLGQRLEHLRRLFGHSPLGRHMPINDSLCRRYVAMAHGEILNSASTMVVA